MNIKQELERRFLAERRAKSNECVSWFIGERRRQERRLTTNLVNWMSRYDNAKKMAS